MNIKATNVFRRLYVFCPKLGQREGEEHKKLLYYYPNTEPLDYRIQTVGFSEAVIGFAETFSSPSDDETGVPPAPYFEVNTDKELQINIRLESEYVLGVAVSKQSCLDQKYAARGRVVYNILRRLYATFVLFFGPFDKLIIRRTVDDQSPDVDALKDRLEYFCGRYLLALRLNQVPLLDLLDGVTYMKLDSTTYLNVQTMINRLSEQFPFIAHSLLLCNDRLLWYTVSQSDLVVLYRYLVQNLLPLSLRNELLQPDAMRRDSSSASQSNSPHHFGKFITGGIGSGSATSSPAESSPVSPSESKLPYVYLQKISTENNTKTVTLVDHYLIAYRILNVTLSLLVPVADASTNLTPDFYRAFDACVGVQMAPLASSLVDAFGKDATRDDASPACVHQYVYFNSVDASLLTTFGNASTPAQASGQTPEIFGALTDLRDEIVDAAYFGDVVAKCGDDDYWVAAKKADEREIYAVIYHKNASLTDIHEEMRKLCSAKFDTKFLMQ